MVLLDTAVPLVSVLGIISTVLITALGFLIKDAYNKVVERVKVLEDENGKLKARIDDENGKLKGKIDILKEKMDMEFRGVDSRMGELKLNILEKLDDIKGKFNEYRK